MKQYLDLLDHVLREGVTVKKNSLEESKRLVWKQRVSFNDALLEIKRSFISKESECNTDLNAPDCDPMFAPQEGNELVMKIELALKRANNGGKRGKRETPLQRRMKRAGASLTYNLLKTGEDKEKLLMEYERRMGNFLDHLDEADCIDEKEEAAWMKLFSGKEVDPRVKLHWLGPAGGLVFLLKLFRQENLFSTPQMWSFWDWVAQRFVLANEDPVSENLRKNHETEDTVLRKKIRQAVDALVYRKR